MEFELVEDDDFDNPFWYVRSPDGETYGWTEHHPTFGWIGRSYLTDTYVENQPSRDAVLHAIGFEVPQDYVW